MKLPPLLVSLISLGIGSANAAIVLTENFTYADGPLTTATGSPWVNHSGTALQANVASNALALTSSESEDINAPLSGQPYTTGFLSATFDVRFTALPSSGGGYFAHFKDAVTGFRSRLTAFTTGAVAGSFRLGISNDGGTTVPVPVDLSLSTLYTVVMTWDMATNRSTLSVNGGSAVTDIDAASAITVTSFAFRQATGIGTLTVDNLSVDYIPEPSATLIGALGMFALLRGRRR